MFEEMHYGVPADTLRVTEKTADVATLVAHIWKLTAQCNQFRAERDEARAVACRLLKERDQARNMLHQCAEPAVECCLCGTVTISPALALHCGHYVCEQCRVEGRAATHNCHAPTGSGQGAR